MNPTVLIRQKKRRQRADVTTFNALLKTPSADQFTMPANGRIRFKSLAGCAAGTTAAVLTGKSTRTIQTPLLLASGSVKLDNVEKDVVVNPSAGFQTEVDCGFGVWRKISGGA